MNSKKPHYVDNVIPPITASPRFYYLFIDALNNLVQQPVFTADSLARIAQELDIVEMSHYGEPSSPACKYNSSPNLS